MLGVDLPMLDQRVSDEQLQYITMSFGEYLELPEDKHHKTEWVEGVAIVSPPAQWGHQTLGTRLVTLLAAAFPEFDVALDAGVQTAGTRYRIPDIVVARRPDDDEVLWATEPPILVIEVISPATRSQDWLRKPHEYGKAGVGQYWIVDRKRRTLTVIEFPDGEPATIMEFDDEHPTGDVTVADHGTVHIDLAGLLR
jgi:Uma2 family endonuclease